MQNQKTPTDEIPPHVLASIGDILQSLKGGVFTVIPDTVGLYKVTLDTGNVCYYHQANKTLFALGVTYAYLKAAGVNVTLFQDSDITALTAPPAVTPNAINSQVGGDHYKSMKIQPWQVMRAVMTREEYTAYQIGTVLAYLMRHKAKGGEQDIKKAQHHLTELVEYLNETPKI
jgi:predicted nucleotidyltransferase